MVVPGKHFAVGSFNVVVQAVPDVMPAARVYEPP